MLLLLSIVCSFLVYSTLATVLISTSQGAAVPLARQRAVRLLAVRALASGLECPSH